MQRLSRLRIGFVPEHFSTPLAFAQKHYGLNADLIPFPTGTGALSGALKSNNDEAIDIAIGLTEGFVADLGKTIASGERPAYGFAGTYVNSPLRWAISTGAARSELRVETLEKSRVGVSRIGSGSYVMSYVLADQKGWLAGSEAPFDVKVIGDFAALRKAVNNDQADFFMWEHFTTKHFWDNGELRRVGEIYTPWPSWMITARKDVSEEAIADLTSKLNKGIEHYRDHTEEAIDYITTNMHYSREDTLEWMKTVIFPSDVDGVDPSVIDGTIETLQKAGVLDRESGSAEDMLTMTRH